MRRFGFTLIAFLVSILVPAARADDPAPKIKLQTSLFPEPADTTGLPVFLRAEVVEGRQADTIRARGDVELRKRGAAVFADEMTYSPSTDQITAEGKVRMEHHNNLLEGTVLEYNLNSETGSLSNPNYQAIGRDGFAGRASGDVLLLQGRKKYEMKQAFFTTCPVGQDDWFLRAKDLEIDRGRNVGTAHGAFVEFRNVPLLYSPWLNFSLDNQRKSGFLTPSFGLTGKSGVEAEFPFYWNIAPNRDATLTPHLFEKRGLQLNTQFRYLQTNYNGEVRFEDLPRDRVAQQDRNAFFWQTSYLNRNESRGWSGNLTLQRVSDDRYFTDFANDVAISSQTNLPRDGYLSYSGGFWSFTARAAAWQTLQDPNAAPVVLPYKRLPQLTLGAAKSDVKGADLVFQSEYDDFTHPTLVSGQRFIMYPSVSYPILTSFASVTPKIGIHYTRYALNPSSTGLPDSTRSLPIFSVDGKVVFERDTKFFAQDYRQTLEPRLYYLYVPFRDQTQIPVFDTALNDFNFAQIFAENQFSGVDRINDANQVTLALTSRMLESETGSERFHMAIGQQYFFKRQEVALPSVPIRSANVSDFVAAAGGNIAPHLQIDGGIQYSPNDSTLQKASFGTRYQPAKTEVLNFTYRFTRDTIRQLDFSAQWPLWRGWYGVARWNYSPQDNRTLESLAGVEYNGGCWVSRFVVHRFITLTNDYTNAVFLQLELNGLAKLGSSPLETLNRNISGYTPLNRPAIPDTGQYR